MNFYFYIFGAIICYIFGDFLAKIWSMKNNWVFVSLALTIYFIGSLLFIFAIKKSSLSLAVATAPLAIAIAGLVIGYFYFSERLTSIQYFGVAFGITALVLLLFPFQTLQK